VYGSATSEYVPELDVADTSCLVSVTQRNRILEASFRSYAAWGYYISMSENQLNSFGERNTGSECGLLFRHDSAITATYNDSYPIVDAVYSASWSNSLNSATVYKNGNQNPIVSTVRSDTTQTVDSRKTVSFGFCNWGFFFSGGDTAADRAPQLTRNPWQIFKAKSQKIYFDAKPIPRISTPHLNLPHPFTSQPSVAVEVDWNNPIAKTSCAIALPTAGGVVQFSNLRQVDKLGTPSGAGIRSYPGQLGLGIGDGGTRTTDTMRLHSVANATTTAWEQPTAQATWMVYCIRYGDNANGNAPIFGNNSASQSPYSAWTTYDHSGTGAYAVECNTGGTLQTLNFGGGSLPNNQPLVLVGRYNGAVLEGFRNGQNLAGSTTCTGNITYPNAADRGPHIGNFYNYTGSARSFNGQVFLAALWPVALSDAEIANLSENPWQIFKPKSQKLYFDPTPIPRRLTSSLNATRSRTSQPQGQVEIDWSNPLTNSLVSLVSPGLKEDYVKTGNVTQEVASTLKGFKFGNLSTDSLETRLVSTNNIRSYFTLAYLGNYSGNGLGRLHDKRTVSAQVDVWFYNWGLDRLELERTPTGSTQRSSVVVGGKNIVISTVFSAPPPGEFIKVYLNGKSVSPASVNDAGSGSVLNNNDPYVIGNRKNDYARNFDGIIFIHGIWDRLLDEKDAWELYTNPWQIFKAK
jgi:hypothetical protein